MRLTQSVSRNVGFNLLVFLLVLLASFGLGAGKKKKHVVVSDKLLNAIWMVESSGRIDPPDGDNGKSIGPLQLQLAYFTDAKEFDKTIDFSYEDCRTCYEKSKRVVRAYMARYAPDNATDEQIARLHNCGPKALKTKYLHLTDKYWKKVKSYL
jgi:hypothetical protein